MDAIREFRKAVFSDALDFLESEWLSEQEVCECLKECIEFFWGGVGVSGDIVRDFCMTKLQRAKGGEHGKAQG